MMPTADKTKQAEYGRAHYQRNKEKMKARAVEHRRRNVSRNRAIAHEAKERPCVDCGRRFPPCAMDFDHGTNEKLDHVSSMVRQGAPVDRIRAEIVKCEVVCACCHRIRHHC